MDIEENGWRIGEEMMAGQDREARKETTEKV